MKDKMMKHYDQDDKTSNLLAAAPDMLEALKQIARLSPSSEGMGGHAPIGAFILACDNARKVIAKAEGK
jgi:hypothetical protein